MSSKTDQRVQMRQSSSSVKTISSSVFASIRRCYCCILQFFSKLDQCFLTPNVGQQQQQQRHLLPPLVPGKIRTIVLDMDETLVHSVEAVEDPAPSSYDFMITTRTNGLAKKFFVLKRPGVDEFLEAISKKYEVVVFTAGVETYASSLLDVLDPKGLISHRLYRDSCQELERTKFTKDLSMIGRDLGNVVIVDDKPRSYALQPENGIRIKRFIDDLDDRELEKLLGFFEKYCDGFDDMRDAVKRWYSEEQSGFINHPSTGSF